MSRCTRANASPKSFVSRNARPPVSDCERRQRVLGRIQIRVLLARRPRRKTVVSTAAGMSGIATRNDGLQSARVHRIDRHVRPHRRVDRGAELDLIVFPAALQPRAEVQHRLLLIDRRERVRDGLQRAKADVVVEHLHRGRVVVGDARVGRLGFVGGHSAGVGRRRRGAFLRRQRGKRGGDRRRDRL